MAKLLGIDVGTSGCKALLIDEKGKILNQSTSEYGLSIPQPMWSEQNPEDWWIGVQKCLREINEPNLDGIGVTGQMHGAVFLDSQDRIIRPAILWNDQRTVQECLQIDQTIGKDQVREITCNPPLTGFQAPKILWLRNNEPENFSALRTVLLPKDYIRFKLTGEKVTDVSDASGTGLFDVPRRKWATSAIESLDLNPSLFPNCVESYEVSGSSNGVPVVGGGGDQASAAVGTGAVVPGIVSVSLGTSGVVFTSLTEPEYDPNGAVHTFCHANGAWHAMSVMLSCGGAVRWFRDTFGFENYDQLNCEASSVSDSQGLTFLPYLTGERSPHNDPFAKSAFGGITLGHARSHFARALFEGVSFGLFDGFRKLEGLGATSTELRVTGGGAKSLLWLKILADVFQKPCVTLQSDEGPAMGAAILAGIGAGIWKNVPQACSATVTTRDTIDPSGTDYGQGHVRYQNLYRATRDWNLAE